MPVKTNAGHLPIYNKDDSTFNNENAKQYAEDIIIWDEDHQFSVVNLVPPSLKERMLARRKENPEFFEMDEHDLLKELRRRCHTPSATDHRLRMKFWMEYDRAMSTYTKMSIPRLCEGVCTVPIFLEYVFKRPHRVSWIMLPPVNYADRMVEALNYGLDQMREILDLPMVDGNGKVDHKLAAMKIAVFKMLDDRSNGVAVQRLEQKSINIQASVDGSELKQIRLLADSMSTKQIKDRLKDAKHDEKEKFAKIAMEKAKVDLNDVE